MENRDLTVMKNIINRLKDDREKNRKLQKAYECGDSNYSYYQGAIDKVNYVIGTLESNFINMPVNFSHCGT